MSNVPVMPATRTAPRTSHQSALFHRRQRSGHLPDRIAHLGQRAGYYGGANPPPPFDNQGYLDFLTRHHHNFVRLWMWESPRADGSQNIDTHFAEPMPYQRTGPGVARDGAPKFDITRFNPAFFERLRARVMALGERGIYASVMLFQGWSIRRFKRDREVFAYHPYHRDNNINGIDGDPRQTGDGEDVHTLSIPAITRLQEAMIRRIVDSVNDLDNVLYEVSNESIIPQSAEWQYHVIRYVHDYEARLPKQHPAGMGSHTGVDDSLSARQPCGLGRAGHDELCESRQYHGAESPARHWPQGADPRYGPSGRA